MSKLDWVNYYNTHFINISSIWKVLYRKARRANRTEDCAHDGEKQRYLKRWKLWFTKVLQAAKLKGKVEKAKWWQSDSKSLDNLAQSKTKSQHFRHWICVTRESELVFEGLEWFSILSTRWLRSDNLFGNQYHSPLAREDHAQFSNISSLLFIDPSVASDLRQRHLKILSIPFDRRYDFLFDSSASLNIIMLLQISRTYLQNLTRIEPWWHNLF